jgi:acyl-CoA thioester hydrolase
LQVSAQITEKGRASIKISQEIRLLPIQDMRQELSNQEQSQLLCHGTICIAWVDSGTLKPGRIPTSILEALI